MTAAVLLDIDGTLVDSNYAHVDAWWRACAAAGRPVDAWRVHRTIGMDSGRLLTELLGDDDGDDGDGDGDVDPEVAEQAKAFHTAYYAEQQPRLHVLPGARELLTELHRRGLAVVLATSAPQQELDVLLRLLDVDDVVTAVTNSDDVDEAKPAPGIVQVALDRVGATPDEAVMVGDAMWDVEAAGRVGVPCIGVRSGGIGADELRDAGAAAVYDDVDDLLRHLDGSPIAHLR